jgi:hypothetical protein
MIGPAEDVSGESDQKAIDVLFGKTTSKSGISEK